MKAPIDLGVFYFVKVHQTKKIIEGDKIYEFKYKFNYRYI